MIAAFLLASLLIILPTYLQGGLDAVLVPYQFHLSRGMEYVALPVLVNNLLVNVFHSEVDSWSFFLLFFVLQVFSPVLSLFLKLDTLEKLMKYSVLVVALFILFSRINSPQWFLWLMPFLILSLRGKLDVVIVILYTTLTYLFCPLVFNVYGNSAPQTQFFALLCYLILVLLAIRAWQVLRFDKGLSFIKLLFNRKQAKG